MCVRLSVRPSVCRSFWPCYFQSISIKFRRYIAPMEHCGSYEFRPLCQRSEGSYMDFTRNSYNTLTLGQPNSLLFMRSKGPHYDIFVWFPDYSNSCTYGPIWQKLAWYIDFMLGKTCIANQVNRSYVNIKAFSRFQQ